MDKVTKKSATLRKDKKKEEKIEFLIEPRQNDKMLSKQ